MEDLEELNTYQNKKTETLQNRFSAYLVAAVTNKRMRYLEKKKQLLFQETVQPDLEFKKYLDFDVQYREFLNEQTALILEDWERFREFMELMESKKLMKVLSSEKEMLKKVNITFEKGKSYAIIGDSGAGKSTLIGMILQLICPNKGDILIDGIKYEEMKPIYSQIAYVSQDVFMFSDTLQFNLFLSDNESEKDIKDLLLKFELDKFMDTDFNEMHIREGATNISGGEKQRISIIRELIKEKPILLMDEATSNVNGEMSEKIYNYLLQQKNVMLICILHNYTDGMLDKFDCVIRVRDGNVTCSGNSEYK